MKKVTSDDSYIDQDSITDLRSSASETSSSLVSDDEANNQAAPTSILLSCISPKKSAAIPLFDICQQPADVNGRKQKVSLMKFKKAKNKKIEICKEIAIFVSIVNGGFPTTGLCDVLVGQI